MTAWALIAVVATSEFCAAPLPGGVGEPLFCRLDQPTRVETPYFSVLIEPEFLVGVHREGGRLVAQSSIPQAQDWFEIEVIESDDPRRWADCPSVSETTEGNTTWRECHIESREFFEKRTGTRAGDKMVVVAYGYSARAASLSPALERMLQSVQVIVQSRDNDRLE